MEKTNKELVLDQIASLKFHIAKLKRLASKMGLQMKAEVELRGQDGNPLQTLRVRQHWNGQDK